MTPREKRLAIDGTTGLVAVSVAAALANLTWRLAGEAGGASPVAAAASAYVRPAAPPDLGALLAQSPFGVAGPALTAAPAGLTLRGVLLADPGSASTVLIAGAQGPSAAYRIGEALPGGARVERIAEDYVVLAVGAGYANLYFPGDERAKAATAAPPVAGAPAAPGLVFSSIAPPPPAPPPPPAIGGPDLVARLGAIRTPQGLQFGAGLLPELRAAGLTPGDVVTNINGVDAAAFAADGGLVSEARAAGQARVEVLRNGIRLTLSVPFR